MARTLRLSAAGFCLALSVGAIWAWVGGWLQTSEAAGNRPRTFTATEPFGDTAQDRLDVSQNVDRRSTFALGSIKQSALENALAELDDNVAQLEELYKSARRLYSRMTPAQRSQVVRLPHASITFDNRAFGAKTEQVTATVTEHLSLFELEVSKTRLIRETIHALFPQCRNARTQSDVSSVTARQQPTTRSGSDASQAIEAIAELKGLAQLDSAQSAVGALHRAKRMCELFGIVDTFLSVEQTEELNNVRQACLLLGQ